MNRQELFAILGTHEDVFISGKHPRFSFPQDDICLAYQNTLIDSKLIEYGKKALQT